MKYQIETHHEDGEHIHTLTVRPGQTIHVLKDGAINVQWKIWTVTNIHMDVDGELFASTINFFDLNAAVKYIRRYLKEGVRSYPYKDQMKTWSKKEILDKGLKHSKYPMLEYSWPIAFAGRITLTEHSIL